MSLTLDYTTDLHSNFGDKYNWVNFLSLTVDLPIEKIIPQWKNGIFYLQLINLTKINDRIAEDIQVFSNIDDDRNLPVNLFLLGYTHQWGKVSLYGGMQNVNEDYFATPYTQLFTNSSAGIFTTISENFQCANYPLSAVGLHLDYKPVDNIQLKSSLYNGIAYDPRDNNFFDIFTVNPRRDGIFSISELSFSQTKFGSGLYSLGIAFQIPGKGMSSKYSLWGAVEQSLFNNGRKEFGMLLHSGFAPKSTECKYYFAAGGYFSGFLSKLNADKFGFYVNITEIDGVKEYILETTWLLQILDIIAIQPTYHYINTGSKHTHIGLFRVLFSITT